MPVQNTYEADRPAGFEGQRANLGLTNITSRVAEDSDIPFGRAVVRGTADNQAKLPTAGGQGLVGVTEMTTAWAEDPNNLHLYTENREMNIIDFGEIWVYSEQAVVPGDAVFFRHTVDTAPLNVLGRFRKDSSGGDADEVVGAAFISTAGAGELAKIKLFVPGVGVKVVVDSSETLTATTSAVSLETAVTYYDSSLGATASSLADGVIGQKKIIKMTVDGGDVTLTPDNFADGTTIVFDGTDSVELLFDGTNWGVVGTSTATVA